MMTELLNVTTDVTSGHNLASAADLASAVIMVTRCVTIITHQHPLTHTMVHPWSTNTRLRTRKVKITRAQLPYR